MRNSRLIGFAAALALLFASCDKTKELPDDESQDGFAAVRIRSLSVAEDGSETFGRSFSQHEPETVTCPIGDGMLLEMNIKQDDSPLRDKILLGEGKKFRVIAANQADGTYYSHGDFTVGESGPSNDFLVRIGEKYDYICISLNSDTDLPPSTGYAVDVALPSFSYDNEDDLLWCKIEDPNPVPSAGVDLNIILKHQLTKVKVKLDCSYNGWKIGVGSDMVSIGDIAFSGSINLSTGNVTGSSPAPQTFASFTSVVDATSQTSNELTIMPKANGTITITVSAAAVSREDLSNIPTANRSTTLTTPLEAGNSYVITTQLRLPIFARSNIYWDNTDQKLTFQPAADDPADNVDTYQGFQGVFFRWGSLVGISPARVGSSDNFINQDVPIYVPNVASSTWVATTSTGVKAAVGTTENWTSWGENTNTAADIPYMDPERGAGTLGRSNTWLIDAERNVPDTLNGFRGDICQYLTTKTHAVTGDYRLPTSDEFGPHTIDAWATGTANADGWIKGGGYFYQNAAIGKPDGTADLLDDAAGKNGGERVYGSAISSPLGVIFPTSGYRQANGGALVSMGIGGYYWSGSTDNTARGMFLRFYNDGVSSERVANRSYAFSVRCVKKVDPTGSY